MIITLPHYEDWLCRLTSVDRRSSSSNEADLAYNQAMQKDFYPHLLQYAGQEMSVDQIYTMFLLAIASLTQGMTLHAEVLFRDRVKDYVEATFDNEEDRNAVLSHMREHKFIR